MKKKIEIDESKKETLYNVLKEGNSEKIQEFLMRNGRKKSYCPICFRKDKIEVESSNLEQEAL